MENDIRWKQRYSNFCKALEQLKIGIEQNSDQPPNLIKEGIIQRFEFTHELAWKVMKDFLEYEGYQNVTGSRTATREAFNKNLISEAQTWMDMIESRNNSVHTYNHEILETEFNKIISRYLSLFLDFKNKMQEFI